jgi:hypothetical protein
VFVDKYFKLAKKLYTTAGIYAQYYSYKEVEEGQIFDQNDTYVGVDYKSRTSPNQIAKLGLTNSAVYFLNTRFGINCLLSSLDIVINKNRAAEFDLRFPIMNLGIQLDGSTLQEQILLVISLWLGVAALITLSTKLKVAYPIPLVVAGLIKVLFQCAIYNYCRIPNMVCKSTTNLSRAYKYHGKGCFKDLLIISLASCIAKLHFNTKEKYGAVATRDDS